MPNEEDSNKFFIELSKSPSLCDHKWTNDPNPKTLYAKAGWYSIGGYPECEERKCVKCGKTQER